MTKEKNPRNEWLYVLKGIACMDMYETKGMRFIWKTAQIIT